MVWCSALPYSYGNDGEEHEQELRIPSRVCIANPNFNRPARTSEAWPKISRRPQRNVMLPNLVEYLSISSEHVLSHMLVEQVCLSRFACPERVGRPAGYLDT